PRRNREKNLFTYMQHTEQDNSHVRQTGQAPIFLIGMMGAGKTTIGPGLARSLGREFLDLDHELEARCGVSIPTIFDIEGEAGFRRREAQVLQDITLRRDVVLATGGGAVVAPENQDRKSTRLNSSHVKISYAVFCLKKKKELIKYIRY